MCGIAGLTYFDGQPPSPVALENMASLLDHRGPDGRGATVQNTIGLAHARLSIVDLTERGAQPMASRSGRYWLTYNGEVYNFLELREELKQKNHRFESESDTEVILAAFEEWGLEAVSRFIGMFAFAIWDGVDQKLHMFRDRFGVKPLYYYSNDRVLAFASEIKALLAVPEVELEFDEQGLSTSISYRKEVEGLPFTAFRNVQKVLPGYRVTFHRHGNRLEQHRWWNLLTELPEVSTLPKRQAETIRALLTDACRLRMRSDVPLGFCLSGGLDSTCVFSTAQQIQQTLSNEPRISADPSTAFIMRLRDGDDEEQTLALAQAESTNAKIEILEDRPAEASDEEHEEGLQYLRRLTYQFEEPGYVFPAQWKLYREVSRAGVRVTLDGHGADECFAGYPFYAEANGLDAYTSLSNAALSFDGMYSGQRSWDSYIRSMDLAPINIDARLPAYHPAFLNPANGQSFFNAPPQLPAPPHWAADEKDLAGTDNLFRAMYYFATAGFLQGILRTYDLASMAHSVESRAPFMDHRLFSYALALPSSSKISSGVGKYMLRKAMKGVIPEAIRTRARKVGLYSPIGYLDGTFGTELKTITLSKVFLNGYPWDGRKVQALLADDQGTEAKKISKLLPMVQAHLLMEEFAEKRRSLSK